MIDHRWQLPAKCIYWLWLIKLSGVTHMENDLLFCSHMENDLLFCSKLMFTNGKIVLCKYIIWFYSNLFFCQTHIWSSLLFIYLYQVLHIWKTIICCQNRFFLFILKVANIWCFIKIKRAEQEARFKKKNMTK
jgi:hypothetical protein